MKLSYSAIWDDTVALLRTHGSLIAALAGVFLFLPALLVHQFAAAAPVDTGAPDAARAVAAMQAYVAANWPLLLLSRVVEAAGSLAILELILGPRGTSVGGAIGTGFHLLPFYFVAFLLANLAIGFGLFLLLVPGLYLMGRLAPLGPVVVAQGVRNPIEALRRTFEATRGRGWAILGLVLLVSIGAGVAMIVANGLLAVLFVIVAGKSLGAVLAQFVAAATGAAFATLLLILYAAVYRALTAQGSARVFE